MFAQRKPAWSSSSHPSAGLNKTLLSLLLFLFVAHRRSADLGRSTQLQGAVEEEQEASPLAAALWAQLHVLAACFSAYLGCHLPAAAMMVWDIWWQSPSGDVQELAEDAAKKVQGSCGLALRAIQIVIFRQLDLIGSNIIFNLLWPHLVGDKHSSPAGYSQQSDKDLNVTCISPFLFHRFLLLLVSRAASTS